MNTSAFLFAFILSLLTLQPAFNVKEEEPAMDCCMKDHCSKNENNQHKNKDKCDNNGCNPFMACAFGNFFLCQKTFQLSLSYIIKKQKRVVRDDKRIVKNISDCWHPPKQA